MKSAKPSVNQETTETSTMEIPQFVLKLRQEFLLRMGDILQERHGLDVCWCNEEGGDPRGNSRFVGHVKDERGDGDENQAHPEDPRAEHHHGLSQAHMRSHYLRSVQTMQSSAAVQIQEELLRRRST